jgi:hypothetical protein
MLNCVSLYFICLCPVVNHIAAVRPVSCQVVPSTLTNETENFLPDVVPVASVPAALKFVPNVSVKLDTPLVVMMKVQRPPAFPPVALNVQAPVGVIVITPSVSAGIVTV